ncbi:MAG: hypothetical protein RMK64_00720 [Rhodovarius sp.]|nr:hypothetical protein [Rhodovarius sp.]MDW8313466.1 hypothetical protein [Rhodovarius sp.]
MMQEITRLDLAPLLPAWLIAAAGAAALLALLPALLRRARGAWWRAAAFLALFLALLQPRLVSETRELRPDIAVLVVDLSDSTRLVPGRAEAIAEARRRLQERLSRLDGLELRTLEVPEAGNQGTRLFSALEQALADIPRARLAGVLALTDGQVHDVPATAPFDAPFHLLLPGRPGQTDRRLRVIEAPGYGIIGRSVELRVAIEDLGVAQPAGAARLAIRRGGAQPREESVPIGREHRIEVPIERGGPTVIELVAETRPDEVSEANNRAVVTINGVRDRLRVLLVSGEPHAGERTWRRLLKADPGVDLVHFTILRPPEKDDLTPLNELSLIAFPVRELFQVKLREFDLIVFDRFANRGILPPAYMRNIADYVRAGGALLVSVGPEFSGPPSLAATPLGAVLPARPLPAPRALREEAFRPQITEIGRRHPVTEGLQPPPGGQWGRWYRLLASEQRSGTAVMESPDGHPLLLLDRVGQGRVALMLSDHIWLWARGHDGGGPHQELLRRLAHWLMREPELEEEELTARIEAGRLVVQRRSLSADPPPEITVVGPDGRLLRAPLRPSAPGRASAELPAEERGMWQVSDGQRLAFAAAAPANGPELADLRALPDRLAPIVQATGGAVRWLGDGSAVPELRRVAQGRETAGGGQQGWLGLRRNADHTTLGIAATPLLPGWLLLPLLLGLAVLAWRREGR